MGCKWKGKTLKCIAVGQCPISDCLLFYHPPSKQTLSCGQGYKFDISHPSGPEFNLEYDNKFIFNTKASIDYIHRPPTHEQNATVFICHTSEIDPSCTSTEQPNGTIKYSAATILNIPLNDTNE